VGLDVVQTNVKRLNGSVTVDSQVGRGTTFRVTLPLTLAIVQAMLVNLGEDVYAIPLTSIIETTYVSEANVSSVKGGPVMRWREQVLPLLYLRQVFAHPGLKSLANGGKQAIMTVAWDRLRAGLVVDELIGQQEIVVKSLSSLLGSVPGLSGCTILGDGRIALIVDVPSLINMALQSSQQEAQAALKRIPARSPSGSGQVPSKGRKRSAPKKGRKRSSALKEGEARDNTPEKEGKRSSTPKEGEETVLPPDEGS
jgi:two-component system chemotaxis sensor kinase CheA